MTSGGNRYLGKALQVVDLRGDHDVYVLGPTDYPPGIDGKAANDDELHVGGSQTSQQLVESRTAQLLRAVPVNCISL